MKECWNEKKMAIFFTLMTTEFSIVTSYFLSNISAIEWANKPSQSDSMTVFINWTIQNVILNWPITLWRHNFHFNVEILIIVCSNEKKKSLLCHGKCPFSHENLLLTWKFLSLLYEKNKLSSCHLYGEIHWKAFIK